MMGNIVMWTWSFPLPFIAVQHLVASKPLSVKSTEVQALYHDVDWFLIWPQGWCQFIMVRVVSCNSAVVITLKYPNHEFLVNDKDVKPCDTLDLCILLKLVDHTKNLTAHDRANDDSPLLHKQSPSLRLRSFAVSSGLASSSTENVTLL